MALKCLLGRLERASLTASHFVTLTYPGEFPAPEDHGTYKNHLRVFGQAMRRQFGAKCCAVWKLEFQRRGAAHFHLMVFGIEGAKIEDVRQWVARRWFEIVASGDERHLIAGTQVDRPRSVAGAMSYLCKYIAKDDQTRPGNFTGRYWGKVNGEALPVAPLQLLDLTEREANCLARCMRKVLAHHVNDSRWKRALSSGGHHMQAAEGFTRVSAERMMSGARSILTVTHGHEHAAGGVVWNWWSGGRRGPPPFFDVPKKYKARANGNARLIVDGSAFLAAFLRGREKGLWREPEPF